MRIDELYNPTVWKTEKEATAVASLNAMDDDDWAYEAVQVFEHMWVVEVRDADGDVLGLL